MYLRLWAMANERLRYGSVHWKQFAKYWNVSLEIFLSLDQKNNTEELNSFQSVCCEKYF
jgi:hypothetical protein